MNKIYGFLRLRRTGMTNVYTMFQPLLPYQILHQTGELKQRAEILREKLNSCVICPRHCLADRLHEVEGFCQSGKNPLVASTVLHFGEEPVLVGTKGAGNVFFGSCNLRCVYCQNWQISHPKIGKRKNEITVQELANRIIDLQNKGCANINFVSPSHFVAQTVEAISLACEKGLSVPLVYNTNAYDDLETLKLLEGIIDIYLPDIKYSDDLTAIKYSQARDYTWISRTAIKEMYRQVGLLQVDNNNLARRGLIVRHLILPNELGDTESAFKFLAEEISKEIAVSVMAQYYPTNKAENIPLLSRKIRSSEYDKVLELLDKYGLENGWVQELEAPDVYRPDFTRDTPFDNRELGL